jgi:hypothetical protein
MIKNITHIKYFLLFITTSCFCCYTSFSQNKDSATTLQKATTTTVTKPKHDPKIATRRSLILPGWGQAYNKEYWKIPLVYGALSIPTITFFYNNTVYKEAKNAYEIRYQASLSTATHQDTLNVQSLETKYQKADINAIQSLRNAARRDRDYSVFWFLIVWGLNIADATVFGHLKDFDVSNNLSMNVRPEFNPFTKSPGLNLSFKFKNKKPVPHFFTR